MKTLFTKQRWYSPNMRRYTYYCNILPKCEIQKHILARGDNYYIINLAWLFWNIQITF